MERVCPHAPVNAATGFSQARSEYRDENYTCDKV